MLYRENCFILIFLVLFEFSWCLTSNVDDYHSRFEHSNEIKQLRRALEKDPRKSYCEFCDLIVPVIRLLIEKNESSHVENVVIGFCNEFKLIDVDVCVGAVHEYKDAVLEVLTKSTYSNKELCSLVFRCQKSSSYPILIWNVTFPADKPKPKPIPPKPPAVDAPILRILHLSDIHIDFEYQVSSEAQCSQPLCCRSSSSFRREKNQKVEASFWGSLSNCDLPVWTAESILRYAAENEKFDFIYFTGDLPAHNVWNQSQNDQLESLSKTSEILAKIFPNKIFYSSIGNHESAPCNLFPMDDEREGNMSWLYRPIAENWIRLGLPEQTRKTIEFGGFYTVSLRPRLRLISLNMNFCSPENFWLFINSTDPLGQLQWLINWLQYAEDHQEKVHIIGHIPPKFCLPSFSWNFHKIVNRYENTISAQFYGHTHNDEFLIFYDEIDRTRPVSLGYITPSLTTFSKLNPAYRVYKVDGDYPSSSFWVLDHRTVILNLTSSNVFNRSIFLDEYAARDAFQMDFLFPNDWNFLVQRLNASINGTLMDSVYRFYTKSADEPTNCKLKCRQSLLCNFITDRSEDRHRC